METSPPHQLDLLSRISEDFEQASKFASFVTAETDLFQVNRDLLYKICGIDWLLLAHSAADDLFSILIDVSDLRDRKPKDNYGGSSLIEIYSSFPKKNYRHRNDLETRPGRIIVSQKERKYRAIFQAIVAQAVSTLSTRRNTNTPKWKSVYDEIRNLSGFATFTREHSIGLLAELTFMSEFLVARCRLPWDKAIASWHGPKMAAQDFQSPDWRIEVKATLSDVVTSIPISNLNQLAYDGPNFYLTHYHFYTRKPKSSREFKNLKLDRLIASIKKALSHSGTLRSEFEKKLGLSGYVPSSKDRDSGVSVYWAASDSRVGQRFYKVNADFPRIREIDLVKMPGVLDVKFSIALSSIGKFSAEETEVVSLVSENSSPQQ